MKKIIFIITFVLLFATGHQALAKTPAGTGDWYYTTSFDLAVYDSDTYDSFQQFTTEALCNTTPDLSNSGSRVIGRDAFIKKKSSKPGGRITPCFYHPGAIPTKTEFDAKLVTFDSVIKHFYFTYTTTSPINGHLNDIVWNSSVSYTTLSDCQTARDSTISSTKKLLKDCYDSPTPPVDPNAVGINDRGTGPVDDTYHLLQPIGGFTESHKGDSIGKYFNTILRIAIGLCAALAVIMIVVFAIVYMGNESVFGKVEAKSKIMSAILGLILALGAYSILYTINPALLGGDITIQQAVISIDPILFENETPVSTKADFAMAGTFAAPVGSAGVDTCVTMLKDSGWKMKTLHVYTNNRMTILLMKDGKNDAYCKTISVGTGEKGFSEEGTGKSEDKQTPKGTHSLGGAGRIDMATSQATAVTSTVNGKTWNIGAAFFGLTIDGKSAGRGIGIHGDAFNSIASTTFGCIKMKNDDLVLLAPYIKRDLPTVEVK